MKNKSEKAPKSKIKQLLPYLIFLGVTIVLLVVFICLRLSTEVCEFFTKKVSCKINQGIGYLSSKIPFSTFEFFVIFALCVLVILLVTIIILLVRKKGLTVLKMLCVLGGLCFLFGNYYIIVAGFAYNRASIEQFYSEPVEYFEFYEIVKYFKDDFVNVSSTLQRDEDGFSVCPYDYQELSDLLMQETSRLGDYYNVDACFSAKPMKVFSQMMSDNGITGITFTPTGDCGVNKLQPSVEYTYTALHEMMHSIGIMRENEANAISCYLLISSDNDYFRYCGYFGYFGYLRTALAKNATKEEMQSINLSAEIYKEYYLVNQYWESQSSLLEKIGDFFNDLYLKMSGSKDGTGSYHETTSTGSVEKVEGDRVIYDIKYNNFQQAFIRTYYDKINQSSPQYSD